MTNFGFKTILRSFLRVEEEEIKLTTLRCVKAFGLTLLASITVILCFKSDSFMTVGTFVPKVFKTAVSFLRSLFMTES